MKIGDHRIEHSRTTTQQWTVWLDSDAIEDVLTRWFLAGAPEIPVDAEVKVNWVPGQGSSIEIIATHKVEE